MEQSIFRFPFLQTMGSKLKGSPAEAVACKFQIQDVHEFIGRIAVRVFGSRSFMFSKLLNVWDVDISQNIISPNESGIVIGVC